MFSDLSTSLFQFLIQFPISCGVVHNSANTSIYTSLSTFPSRDSTLPKDGFGTRGAVLKENWHSNPQDLQDSDFNGTLADALFVEYVCWFGMFHEDVFKLCVLDMLWLQSNMKHCDFTLLWSPKNWSAFGALGLDIVISCGTSGYP